MKVILGIETSCDETACAIVTKLGDRLTIASNVIASSAALGAAIGPPGWMVGRVGVTEWLGATGR